MTREEKVNIIEGLTEKFSNNENYYFTDASGLSVAETNALRRICFEKGVDYKVYKNTLILKALEKMDPDADWSIIKEEVLKGFTGIMFSQEVSNLPAKVIKQFRKKGFKEGLPKLKGASIESELFVGEEHLNKLSELKSREELISEVIGLLQSPAKNVISALQSSKHKLAGIIKTLSEKENN